jgi:hypothetical protein
MRRHIPSRLLVGALAAFALVAAGCGDDDGGGDTTPAATAAPTEATEAATQDTTAETEAPDTTEAAATFEGELVGTFGIDAGECADAATVSGSYFRMLQPDGTYIMNADSTCGDQTYSALSPGTDGGLATGTSQVSPDPAFDDANNGLADAIFEPVKFFGVDFAGAMDAAEAVPMVMATGGELTGELVAFTAYYGGQAFNQGGPKPDGSGVPATGTIDPATGEYVLEWTSLIVGGSFDGFTGVWHLEGTFTPAS